MNTNDDLFRSLPPPWDRILPTLSAIGVWSLFFSVIYLLRSFFLLLFLTFVFSYIQARGVNRLESYIVKRIPRVMIVSIAFWSILIAAAVFLVPKVKAQTEVFASQFSTYLASVDKEIFQLGERYPVLGNIIPELLGTGEDSLKTVPQAAGQAVSQAATTGTSAPATPPAADATTAATNAPPGSDGEQEKRLAHHSPTTSMLQQIFGFGSSGGAQNLNHTLGTLGNVGGKLATAASSFFLGLLFSFLIVLDLPNLATKVQELANTRLGFIYRSVAANICEFSQVLGRALEAQLIIAIANSFLTAIGITVLGMGQHVAFLSVIVFFCSFFPVIGVFISSVPICLIALQTSGLQTMLLAVLLITIIHIVEGYILNPRIYGSYMRINSVIILIILTIAGKLFNFWGLLLGVPVCTYIFGYAIRFKKRSEEEHAGQLTAAAPTLPDFTEQALSVDHATAPASPSVPSPEKI